MLLTYLFYFLHLEFVSLSKLTFKFSLLLLLTPISTKDSWRINGLNLQFKNNFKYMSFFNVSMTNPKLCPQWSTFPFCTTSSQMLPLNIPQISSVLIPFCFILNALHFDFIQLLSLSQGEVPFPRQLRVVKRLLSHLGFFYWTGQIQNTSWE